MGLMLEKLLPLGSINNRAGPKQRLCNDEEEPSDGGPSTIAEDVAIYRPPGIKGRRYTDEDIGGAESYTVEFNKLEDTRYSRSQESTRNGST